MLFPGSRFDCGVQGAINCDPLYDIRTTIANHHCTFDANAVSTSRDQKRAANVMGFVDPRARSDCFHTRGYRNSMKYPKSEQIDADSFFSVPLLCPKKMYQHQKLVFFGFNGAPYYTHNKGPGDSKPFPPG